MTSIIEYSIEQLSIQITWPPEKERRGSGRRPDAERLDRIWNRLVISKGMLVDIKA